MDRLLRVGDSLALGDLAHQPLSVLGEGDDGRRRSPTLGVRDDDRVATLHHRNDGVRGAEVNANDL
jgi:hypothetical protein